MVTCMSEKVILVSPSCPGCTQLKEHLTKLGVIDKYRVIDVSTEEGTRVAEELGISHVPNCVIVEKTNEGMMARACTKDEFSDLLKGK